MWNTIADFIIAFLFRIAGQGQHKVKGLECGSKGPVCHCQSMPWICILHANDFQSLITQLIFVYQE